MSTEYRVGVRRQVLWALLHKFLVRGNKREISSSLEKFKLLLEKCHSHNLDNIEQMQHFTQCLIVPYWMLLDASIGGTMNNKNEDEVNELIENICQNEYTT